MIKLVIPKYGIMADEMINPAEAKKWFDGGEWNM